MKRKQTALADHLLPRALFSQAEQPEGRAIVALEIYRADKNSDLPQKAANELRDRGAELTKLGPASAQTLFLVLKTEKAPTVVSAPTGAASDGSRYAYTGFHLLEDRPADALKVAQMTGRPESQLRALALYADWAADPTPALDAALAIVSGAGKKDTSIAPSSVLRLAQIAAAAGKHDMAKQFAEKLADPGLQAWARGEAVRARLAAAPKEKGDESWAELPDDAKKYRAGHALGRLVLARHNARLSGDRAAEVKTVSAWPAPFSLFGKAGVALGVQDRDK